MTKENQDLIRELGELIVLLSDEDNDYSADYIASKYLYDLAMQFMEGSDA